MECKTVVGVYLMLKSSDFCTHELVHALEGLDEEGVLELEYELVLMKWSNLHKSMEFQYFVGNRKLG